MDYQQADAFLCGGRDKDNAYRPLPGVATYMHRIDADTIAVRYHATDVVLIHRDGTYTLDTGGWETNTTKARIGAYSPATVYTEDFGLYLSQETFGAWDPVACEYPDREFRFSRRFEDGVRVDSRGLAVA